VKKPSISGLSDFLSQYDSLMTKVSYGGDIVQFFAYNKKTPKEINKSDILGYLNHLKGKKLAPASIQRKIRSIKSYFKFMYDMELIENDPFNRMRLKLPRINREGKKWLTNKDVKKILKKIPSNEMGLRDRAIILLMLYNGLRRGEVANLTMGDIQRNDKMAVVVIHGKGDKTRIRPLHEEPRKAILKYLKTTNRSKRPKKEKLFVTVFGDDFTRNNIYRMVKKYGKNARVSFVHPHMFRAKFASMALEAGVEITSLQEDMGHSSIETTAMYDASKRSLSRSSVHRIGTLE